MYLLFWESITLKNIMLNFNNMRSIKNSALQFPLSGYRWAYSLAPRVIIQLHIIFFWELYIYNDMTEHIFGTLHIFYFICVSFCWTSSYSLIFGFFIPIKLLYFQDKLLYSIFFWGKIPIFLYFFCLVLLDTLDISYYFPISVIQLTNISNLIYRYWYCSLPISVISFTNISNFDLPISAIVFRFRKLFADTLAEQKCVGVRTFHALLSLVTHSNALSRTPNALPPP